MELRNLLTPPSDSPPRPFNWQYRNSMQYWSGFDQRNQFEKNLKNSKAAQQLQDFGWVKTQITYCYNSHGFRSAEFDSRECGIALGCSFTEGVGLPVESTWPHLLSNLCGTQVWNLGSGGASIETVFRIFEHYVQTLSPTFVCVLTPPPMRFEFNDSSNGFPIIHANQLGNHDSFAKDWLSQDFNGTNNRKKTMLAIAKICELLKIPMVFNYSEDPNSPFHAHARDLSHPGVEYQHWQAKYMYDQLQQLGVC